MVELAYQYRPYYHRGPLTQNSIPINQRRNSEEASQIVIVVIMAWAINNSIIITTRATVVELMDKWQ